MAIKLDTFGGEGTNPTIDRLVFQLDTLIKLEEASIKNKPPGDRQTTQGWNEAALRHRELRRLGYAKEALFRLKMVDSLSK